MDDAAPKSYRLIFEAERSNSVPPIIRLRRLLKYALRETGLRCVSVVDCDAPEQGAERKRPPQSAGNKPL